MAPKFPTIGLLSLLSALLSSAASPAQIYIDPRPLPISSGALTVPPADANSILSHHLGIASYENGPLPAFVDALGLESEESPFATPKGALIILVEGVTAFDYLPSSIAHSEPTLIIPSSPAPSAWTALLTTYLGRIAAVTHVHLTDIYGFESLAREAGSLLKDWSEWASDEAVEGWQWVKDSLHLTAPEVWLPVEPKESHSKFFTNQDLFDASAAKFLEELQDLDRFVESLSEAQSLDNDRYFAPSQQPPYAALHFKGLEAIEAAHGKSSESYKAASEMLKGSLEAAITTFRVQRAANANVITITIPSVSGPQKRGITYNPFDTHVHKRSLQRRASSPTPMVPVNQACFRNESACMNSTDNCSGHGACASGFQAGKADCWVCACNSTVTNGSTTYWTGANCQKADVSTQFFLLAGSTILLLVLVMASISLLFGVGQSELPSQLAAVGGMSHRHDH